MKRGRGRPPGSKNKPKVIDDYMPGRLPVLPAETRREASEPEAETLATFARSVLNDDKVRKSIRERAQAGLLTPTELKALSEWAADAPVLDEKPTSPMAEAMAEMTPAEIRILADAARKAIAVRDARLARRN